MEIKITRRELLRFAGGSAIGFLLTPVPWKALGDSANWTQNWPWIPEPQRGDVSYKFTSCSLCPAACGVRARCIGMQPVGMSGTAMHPLNAGTLCSAGIVAHHLRYHPSRVSRPLRITGKDSSAQRTVMTIDEVLHDIVLEIEGARADSQTIALVDGRPGRVVSHLFQQFAAGIPQGTYIPVGEPSLHLLASMFEKPAGPFSYDIDHANTILSFGVPLFDGWGTPARTAKYLDHSPGAKQLLIQVDPFQSRTAGMADQWIPIKPGTDAVFALGIASILLNEKLVHAKPKDITELEKIVSAYSPSIVAEVCGIPEHIVKEAAHSITAKAPSVAVIDGFAAPRETQTAVMLLNYLIGSVGKRGGIVPQREVSTGLTEIKNAATLHSDIYSIPDHSVRVMIVDESLSGCRLPDALLQQKLTENGVLVSISPFVTERPFCTQYVVPSPVFLESLTDLTGSPDSDSSTLSISNPLVPEPTGVLSPLQFIQRLADVSGNTHVEPGTMEELLKKRIAAIYKGKRGMVFTSSNGQRKDVRDLSSPDDLWNALLAGGCWVDTAEELKASPAFHCAANLSAIDRTPLKSNKNQLMLIPFVEQTPYDNSEISPLFSKVGRESGLRHYGCKTYLNPKTAGEIGISDGSLVVLQTSHGSIRAEARMDSSIMPDFLVVSNTANPQDVFTICDTNSTASLVPTPVKIQKV